MVLFKPAVQVQFLFLELLGEPLVLIQLLSELLAFQLELA